MKTPLERFLRDQIRSGKVDEAKILISMLPENKKNKYREVWKDEIHRINSGLPTPDVELQDGLNGDPSEDSNFKQT